MKIDKVLDRLRELFPNDLIFSDIWENMNERYVLNIGGENNTFCFLKYDESGNYNEIKSVTIRNKSWSINCDNIKPEELFDLENSNIYFHDYDKCKNFIKTHSSFPKTLYYNNGILFFSNDSDVKIKNNLDILKISDITKYSLIKKPTLVKD